MVVGGWLVDWVVVLPGFRYPGKGMCLDWGGERAESTCWAGCLFA